MLTRRALSYSCGVLSRVQHSSRLLLSTASELASSVDGPRVSGTSVHHGMVYEPLVDEKAVETYRRTHQIHMRGRGLAEFPPITSFEAAQFHPNLYRVIEQAQYTEPTPIQAQSWPLALKGRDMISVARTGSGKTCAFLLPAIHKLVLAREMKKQMPKQRHEHEGAVRSQVGADEVDDRMERRARRREEREARGFREGKTPPKVLILAPTRELCVQIGEEASKFGGACGIKTATIYGGAGKHPQIKAIEAGAQIIIATPGRCNDLANMGVLNLSQIEYFVLDEADRMLDMGFEPQINDIVERLPAAATTNAHINGIQNAPEFTEGNALISSAVSASGPELCRQTLFFSATWPKEVQSMAAEYLTNPVLLQMGVQNELNANKAIKQEVKVINEADKMDELLDTLEDLVDAGGVATGGSATSPASRAARSKVPKTIIFRSTKASCDDLANALRQEGYAADSLHGDKSQNERDNVMDRYRAGRTRVLVATDVASRGLDIKDIEVVVNYDFPNDVEDYVHRIGRTGRAERTGVAFTFITQADKGKAEGLIELLKRSDQEVPAALTNMYAYQRSSSSSPFTNKFKSKYRVAGQPIQRRTDFGFGGFRNSNADGGGSGGFGGRSTYNPSSNSASNYFNSMKSGGSSASSSFGFGRGKPQDRQEYDRGMDVGKPGGGYGRDRERGGGGGRRRYDDSEDDFDDRNFGKVRSHRRRERDFDDDDY